MRTELVQISTTVDSRKAAETIALRLLEKRLAACVQVVGPITSHYWWRGKIVRAKEWLCFIKARARDYRTIQATIKKIHPYEIPEILGLPVSNVDPVYLSWIKKETIRKVSR